MAQSEVKEASPVTSGIVGRLASKEESSCRTKDGKERKRGNDSVEQENEAGSYQAVKKRKGDQKKRQEIAELEELLEKKKKELHLVNREEVPEEKSSDRKRKNKERDRRDKAFNEQGQKDLKPNKRHEVSKKENLTRSQINLSWTDGESEEEGEGSNIKSSISFSQRKDQSSEVGKKIENNLRT